MGGGSVAGPTMEDMKLCWPLLYATKGDDTGGKWWLYHGAQSSMTSHNFRTSGTWYFTFKYMFGLMVSGEH